MSPPATTQATPPASQVTPHSRRALLLKTSLLLVWFCISFVACFFARDLQMVIVGWPLNYWLGAQGALLVFIAVVGVYAWVMNRIPSENLDVADDH
jgi:putative solute:sodium symporter small subunit